MSCFFCHLKTSFLLLGLLISRSVLHCNLCSQSFRCPEASNHRWGGRPMQPTIPRMSQGGCTHDSYHVPPPKAFHHRETGRRCSREFGCLMLVVPIDPRRPTGVAVDGRWASGLSGGILGLIGCAPILPCPFAWRPWASRFRFRHYLH